MEIINNTKFNKKTYITNYHLKSTELAMAEAITNGTLSSQMTQHCLGTGIYGFINNSNSNKSTFNYKLPGYIPTQFEIFNPIILSNTYKEDGEKRTDLNDFTWFSMNLNLLCNDLYTNKKEANIQNIFNIFQTYNIYPIDDNNEKYKLTSYLNINISDISYMITFFLLDYEYLISIGEFENYILMPINYILFNLGYDGIYNLNDDTGTTGSVKYFFDGTIARGYRANMKKRSSLDGHLIFLGKIYDRKMIN